jgi:hypothetical protein
MIRTVHIAWRIPILILGILAGLTSGIFAQSPAEWERAGDMMLREGDHIGAQICFQKAMAADSLNGSLNRKLGEAAMAARDYPLAAQAFRRAALKASAKDKAGLNYLAAINYKQSGEYFLWENYLRLAASQEGDADDELTVLIRHELASLNEVRQLRGDTNLYAVWNAGSKVNGEYAETSPFRLADSLILFSTSTPHQAFSPDFDPDEQQFRIMEVPQKVNGLGRVKEMSTRINAEGFHNAHPAVTSDGSRMYFTRCIPGVPRPGGCGIWFSRNQRGKWGKPRPVEGLNLGGYNSTQPCLAYIQGQEVLYFASDRPGGKGGWDIWYSVLIKGRPAPAVNLGSPLNTPGNEWAPTSGDSSEGLWFSSDWHPGLGGYDLFYSSGGFNQWSKPKNLGIPLNSPADDLWYVPESGGKPGLLVSNRKGSQHHAGETCCYDLYLHRAVEARPRVYQTDSLTLARQLAAQKLNTFLPLNLFFDNDQPDPASVSDTTTTFFLDLLNNYINRQGVFEKVYTSGLSGEQTLTARDSLRSFFSDEVQGSVQRLDSLLWFIDRQIANGYSISLVLRAFASPLNTPEYNEALASRRATSVRNELRRWEGGRLTPYLDSARAFTVVEIPVGERTSANRVSDDPSDQRNSVFSPLASRERRVSILYGTVDGHSGHWGGAPTIVEIEPAEEIPLNLDTGERKVIRLRLYNQGVTTFYCRSIWSAHPQAEVVIGERKLAPGGQTDVFLMLRGPLRLATEKVGIRVSGNLYSDPYLYDLSVE